MVVEVIMKKIGLFIIMFLFPILVFAKEYTVEEVNLKLSLNDDWYVFTRSNLNGNKGLEELGISKEKLLTTLEKSSIYIDSIPKGKEFEFLLVIPKTDLEVNNLNNYTDSLLEEVKGTFKERFDTEKCDIYKTDNHKFIVIDYYDSNLKYYIVNYYTIVDNKGYNFQLQKKSEVTDTEKAELKKIVDSIKINVLDDAKEDDQKIIEEAESKKKNNIWANAIKWAIIGGAIGGLSGFIGLLIRKKKSSV